MSKKIVKFLRAILAALLIVTMFNTHYMRTIDAVDGDEQPTTMDIPVSTNLVYIEYGEVPEIVVELWMDGENTNKTVELVTSNNRRASFTDLEINDAEGKPHEYTIKVQDIENYITAVSGDAENGFVVSIAYNLREYNLEIFWEDEDDLDRNRPESFKFVLYRDGKPYTDKEMDSGNEMNENYWQHSESDLERYHLNNGALEAYSYGWKAAEDVEYYSLSYEEAEDNRTKVTAKYSRVTVESTVFNVWDDDSNRDGIRPTEIVVTLTLNNKNVEGYENVKLNAENNWTATAQNLLEKYERETAVYKWVVTQVEGYTPVYAYDGNKTTITYTHTPILVDSTVLQVWEDDNNRDGVRPDKVYVTLQADGVEVEGYKNVELNENNNWTVTASQLLKNEAGKAIDYKWVGASVEGYTTESTSEQNATTFTSTHELERTTATVSKVWDDADDHDGLRPELVRVTLVANGVAVEGYTNVELSDRNRWSLTADGLLKNENGTPIEYKWVEAQVEGYTAKYEYEDNWTFITNIHTPEVIEITVKKVWVNDREEYRPQNVVITLYVDGVETDKAIELTKDNEWKSSFTGLDKYRDNGIEIKYTVVESPVKNYNSKVTGNQQTGFIVTNTLDPSILTPGTGDATFRLASAVSGTSLVLLGFAIVLRKKQTD